MLQQRTPNLSGLIQQRFTSSCSISITDQNIILSTHFHNHVRQRKRGCGKSLKISAWCSLARTSLMSKGQESAVLSCNGQGGGGLDMVGEQH